MRIEVTGDATLYLGDCLEIMPTLGKVDAVVTDPPYGIGDLWQGGKRHGWGITDTEKLERNIWDKNKLPQETIDFIIDFAPYVAIWGGNYFALPPSRGWLVWNKPERGFTLSEAELAWTNRDTIIRVFDRPRHEANRQHPTQKPLDLMLWHIKQVNGIVLDPFMGSGTTGVACMNLGRKFIGIEIEPKYFDIACKRIDQAQRQGQIFQPEQPKTVQETLL